MTAAEAALSAAAANIPADLRERLDTTDSLSDAHREAIIQIAREALAPFQPKPDPEGKA
jgi:F-type H+-transporting ATPase subunit alpha